MQTTSLLGCEAVKSSEVKGAMKKKHITVCVYARDDFTADFLKNFLMTNPHIKIVDNLWAADVVIVQTDLLTPRREENPSSTCPIWQHSQSRCSNQLQPRRCEGLPLPHLPKTQSQNCTSSNRCRFFFRAHPTN